MKIDAKWVAMFVAPVVAIAIVGYVYVRSLNRGLESRMVALQQQNDAMHGELYRLRQEVEGKEARLRFINDPGMQRFIAVTDHSDTSCWLFWRKADNAWYAEVTHAEPLPDGRQYRLYARGLDWEYVGSFEPLAETVGLQKIGVAYPGKELIVTAADRGMEPELNAERVVYRAEPAQD